MDPVDQTIETYVISPLSDFLARTSEMDALHYEHIQKFSNAVGSLFTGSNAFSGPAADATANLAGDYLQAENRLNSIGTSERLNDIKALCDATIKTLQWDMQTHWIPWVDYQQNASHSSLAMGFAGIGSIGIGGGLVGGLEATAVGAALVEALAAVAIVAVAAGETILKQKEDEVIEAVGALAALVGAVEALAGTAEVALPHAPGLVIAQLLPHIYYMGQGNRKDTANQQEKVEFEYAWKEIQRRLGKKLSKADRRRLHDEITKQGFTPEEIIEIGVSMFGDY